MQRKISDKVAVPENLDLTGYARDGIAAGEVEMSEGDASATMDVAEFEIDASVVAGITSMGFTENAAKRAAINTDNASVDVAMDWVLAHMEDSDINDDITALLAAKNGASSGGPSHLDLKAILCKQRCCF